MNALLSHFIRMQGRAQAYLIPEDYRDRDGKVVLQGDNNNTEQWKQGQRGARAEAFANDILYDLDGPEQRAAQAEAEFDYLAETEVTASGMDGRHNVGVTEFRAALVDVIRASQVMDQYKKVLFRDRSRGQAGLKSTVTLEGMLDSKISKTDLDLLHGIVGVITESGELAEVLLNKLAHDQPFDRTNVREEIGDQLWYLARLVKWAGTTFFDEMVRNIKKLRSRHGASGFSTTGDVNRNLENERAVLEGRTAPQFPGDPNCRDV